MARTRIGVHTLSRDSSWFAIVTSWSGKATMHVDPTNRQVRFEMASVEDPLAPETDKVRGTLKHGSYVLTPIESGRRTLLEVEIVADPNGNIPKWIVNLFQKGWPHETIESIRRQAAKADVVEYPQIEELLAMAR